MFRPDNNSFNSRNKYSGGQNIYSNSGPGAEFGGGLGHNTSFSYNRRTDGQGQASRRNSFSNNFNSNSNNNRPMSGFQNNFDRNTAANNRPASSGCDYV